MKRHESRWEWAWNLIGHLVVAVAFDVIDRGRVGKP